MDTSTLLIFALAATLAAATPIPLHLVHPPLQHLADVVPLAYLGAAVNQANTQIQGMQNTLANPHDPVNWGRITAAFGPNPSLPGIQTRVNRLANEPLHLHALDPQVYDTQKGRPALAQVVLHKNLDGSFHSMGVAQIGSKFYNQLTDKERAGALIHEATHQQSQTGDDVLETHDPTTGTSTYHVLHPGARPIGGHMPPNQQVHVRAGYAKQHGGEINLPTDPDANWRWLRDNTPNMHHNADSYKVFGALCARSLYKRALSQDDPVGYFLARRQHCTIPPKKATAKAAAGTTAAGPSKSPTTKGANSKAATAKATKSKGLTTQKAGKGRKALTGAKAAKGARKATKGTGTKAARNPLTKVAKGVRGAKATKGPKSLKRVKAIKATKGLKAVKGVKGLKATKATKGVKASKASKVVKGAKSLKGPKGVKATKAVQGVKSVKATKGAKPSRSTFGKFTAQTSGKSTASSVLSKLSPNVSPQRSVTSTKPAAQVAVASTKKKGGKMARRDLESVLEELD